MYMYIVHCTLYISIINYFYKIILFIKYKLYSREICDQQFDISCIKSSHFDNTQIKIF